MSKYEHLEDHTESEDDISDLDEPEDYMTLVQYQDGLKKEMLVRRGLQAGEISHKKGRMDKAKAEA